MDAGNCIMRHLNSFDDLPENIILEIFKYLSLRELFLVRRVCKRWKRIAADRCFWRAVDLRFYKLDVRSLRKLIRNHMSDVLTTIKIKGLLDYTPEKAGLDVNKFTITDTVLKDLEERCPNLKQFEMSHANLSSVNLSSFPASIESLLLTSCLMPCGWFECLANSSNLQFRFTHLDLTESRKLSNVDLSSICQNQTGLLILKLNGCYRLSGQGMMVITNLKDLVTLEMNQTRCDDLLIHHLCLANRKLENLDLSYCMKVNDQSLENLSTLPCLKSLHLEGCKGVSHDSVGKMSSAKKGKIFIKFDKSTL